MTSYWNLIYGGKPRNAMPADAAPVKKPRVKKPRQTSARESNSSAPVSGVVRAISIRQPYLEVILLGEKTIEYRSRKTNIRERVYLYASLTPGDAESFEDLGVEPGDLPTGVIVGTVEIVDCTGDDSDYEWHLANPERLASPLVPKNQPQPGIWRPQF